jgi:glutathione synthase/RimK-type ligase-like ATP-grasp enzyme
MDDLTHFVSDDALSYARLAELGVEVEEVPWRRPAAEAQWQRFELVVIRTPWDYQRDVEGFLATLAEIAEITQLANPLPLVRWNVRKTYLQELAQAGIAIVPSRWFPGGLDASLASLAGLDGWPDELVIKPIVSANADDTFRIAPQARASGAAAIERAFAARPCLVQPFVRTVPTRGEISIVVFDGDVSHALRKTPKAGDFRVQEEHGGEISREPIAAWMHRLTARVMAVMTSACADAGGPREPPLLARIDVVWGDGEVPWIMEVEAIEPSLYLRTDPEAPRRFAQAVARRVGRTRPAHGGASGARDTL